MSDVLSIVASGEGSPISSSNKLSLITGQCGQIIGVSASGKSQLLKSVALRQKASDYKIILFGEDLADVDDIAKKQLKQRITFVGQDCKPLPHLTVFDNLALALRLQVVNEDKIKEYCNQLLTWLKLLSLANKSVEVLSQGQSKLLVLAQAIVRQPELLIIDDLHNGLDAYDMKRISFLLEKISQKGMALLVSNHEAIPHIPGPRMVLMTKSI